MAPEDEPTASPTPAGTAPAPSLSRRRLLWLGVGGAVVAGLGVAGLTLGQEEPTATGGRAGTGGGRAEPFELPRLDGKGTVSLASFRGRPVVVNFFASWCVPCRKELPAFQETAARVEDRVAFLGIDHQDDRAGGLQLLADTGVTFPAGYDPDGSVAQAYGLFGMPTTLFVSADGTLLEKHTGEMSRRQLEDAIERHFGVS